MPEWEHLGEFFTPKPKLEAIFLHLFYELRHVTDNILSHARSIGAQVGYYLLGLESKVVLCDTWNWSDDNDTVSGIAILDTTAIPEMRIAQSNSNVVQNSPVSDSQ